MPPVNQNIGLTNVVILKNPTLCLIFAISSYYFILSQCRVTKKKKQGLRFEFLFFKEWNLRKLPSGGKKE